MTTLFKSLRKVSILTVLTLFLILFSFSVTATTTSYEQTGIEDESTFEGGTSVFTETVDVTIGTASLSAKEDFLIPKYADIDNDNVTEVVMIDGSTIRIFNSKSLTLEHSASVSAPLSDIQLHDIDEDGLLNVVYLSDDGSDWLIREYQWNTTTLTSSTLHTLTRSANNNLFRPQGMLKCGTDFCGIVIMDSRNCTAGVGADEDATAISLHGYIFNVTNRTSNVGSNEVIAQATTSCNTGRDGYYLPLNPFISVGDIDGDAVEEFAFTYLYRGFGVSSRSFLSYMSLNPTTFRITLDVNQQLVNYGSIYDTQIYGNEYYHKSWVTSPIIHNADGVGNPELIIGVVDSGADLNEGTNRHEFKLRVYDDSATIQDTHPFFDSLDDMAFMSNPVPVRCFDGESNDDYGIMVYPDTDINSDEKDVFICGSVLNSFLGAVGVYDTLLFETDERDFNISKNDVTGLLHTVRVAGIEEDVLLTPYGTYTLDHTGLFCDTIITGTGNCDLEFEWDIPNPDGSVQPIDIENEGFDDVLQTTSSNLFYYDDSYVNTNPNITSLIFEPCLEDSIIKQNETVRVTATVQDLIDGDRVQARALLYFGETNEQDTNWSNDFVSGTAIVLPTMVANETTSSSILRIEARDVEHTTADDVYEQIFRVGVNGVEFGECQSIITGLVEGVGVEADEEEAIPIEGEINSNALRNTVAIGSDVTGLSGNLLWLMFMAFISYLMWVGTAKNGQQDHALGAIMVVDIILLITGAFLGFISVGILITVMIIAITVIGLLIMRFFNTGTGGGK